MKDSIHRTEYTQFIWCSRTGETKPLRQKSEQSTAVGKGTAARGQERTYWVMRLSCILTGEAVTKDLHTCHNSLKCTLKSCAFSFMEIDLHYQKKDKKIKVQL